MALEATADDNVSVARVDFRVRGVVVATDTIAPFAASLDTRTIADGAAAVTATAVDDANLSTTTTAVNVTVDNTLPTLTVNGPNNAELQDRHDPVLDDRRRRHRLRPLPGPLQRRRRRRSRPASPPARPATPPTP